MTSIQAKAKQSEAIARASIGRLSNDRLAETWMLTNGQAATRAVTITRGWLLDEIETRMDRRDREEMQSPIHFALGSHADRFGRWLAAECTPGSPVNPLRYLY